MPSPNILVVVVDGLRASALGAYGNTSFPTPALDRFAADSFLLDWCYASSVDLAAIYRDLWQVDAISLPRQLKSNGYTTTLVTDDPDLKSFAATNEFDQCLQLGGETSQKTVEAERTGDVSHTSLAQLFATAADVAASTAPSPRLVWLHARGMYGPWDAPVDLQQSLLDEGDPLPVEDVHPPDFVTSDADDPDSSFRYACAYAAQTMILDESWETLLNAVDSTSAADRWLVTLIGARGYPLGEHCRVGGVDPRLYAEQLHVPWLIRFPDGAGQLGRSAELTSHCDFARLLAKTMPRTSADPLTSNSRSKWRNALVATSAIGHRAIRTSEWCLRQDPAEQRDGIASTTSPANAENTCGELFVRPDDRWEANDVAKLCPDIVDSLANSLNEALQTPTR